MSALRERGGEGERQTDREKRVITQVKRSLNVGRSQITVRFTLDFSALLATVNRQQQTDECPETITDQFRLIQCHIHAAVEPFNADLCRLREALSALDKHINVFINAFPTFIRPIKMIDTKFP